MQVRYKYFATNVGYFFGKPSAYDQAAAFASQVGPERLISISQPYLGVVVVWYCAENEEMAEGNEEKTRMARLDGR